MLANDSSYTSSKIPAVFWNIVAIFLLWSKQISNSEELMVSLGQMITIFYQPETSICLMFILNVVTR